MRKMDGSGGCVVVFAAELNSQPTQKGAQYLGAFHICIFLPPSLINIYQYDDDYSDL